VASEPSWDDIFGPDRTSNANTDPGSADTVVVPSRRALRDAGSSRRPRRGGGGRAIAWTIVAVVVVGALVAGGVYVWNNYGDKIQDALGIAPPNDYSGEGNGEPATIVIEPNDIGADVARKLEDAGVTRTFDAFYALLLEKPEVQFQPGTFQLQKEMSAAAALAALQDPANKLVNTATIPEGVSAQAALALISSATSIPLEELQAAAEDYTQFGVPKKAPSIEGFLFPATYTFDPGVTATDAIQRLVDEMFSRLDAAGVEPGDRLTVLTKAALVQRESGPNVEDMAKIARVFENRLARGMNLQSDATVAYGTGNTHTVWTTGEERADASNPYNTYANPGLPIGPIGLPGDDAINAALHPADGAWLYFVPINLKTGETVFSNTLAEHDRAVAELQAWCRESDENASYCA